MARWRTGHTRCTSATRATSIPVARYACAALGGILIACAAGVASSAGTLCGTVQHGTEALAVTVIEEYASSAAVATVYANQTGVFTANTAPVLSWTGEPGFESDGVAPDLGTPQTVFSFRVRYQDNDGNAPLPGYPRVHLIRGGTPVAGSPFVLVLLSGTVSAGAVYGTEMTLPLGADYATRFEALDAEGLAAVGPPTVARDIPDVVEHPLFRVTGTVRAGTVPVVGAALALVGAGTPRTVLTGADGSYKFADLSPEAAFEILPAATGYVFQPPQRSYAGLSDHITGQDFIAVSSPGYRYFSIGGRVRDRHGLGLSGVLIRLTGVRTSSAVTDALGEYRFLHCGAGAYALTAYKPGVVFDPPVREISLLYADRITEDFAEVPYVLRLYPGEVRVFGGLFGPARPRFDEHVRIVCLPARSGEIIVRVRDLRGRTVWTTSGFVQRYVSYTTMWACVTTEGNPVAAGVYVLEVIGPELNARLRVAVVR